MSELVGFGALGKHNEDLLASQQRILEGATWKHARTIIILPAAKDIPTKVALTHWSLSMPPNQACYRILAQGFEVGDAYNNAVQAILDHPDLSQWEFILTIESDNCPPPHGLLKLIAEMHKHPEYACIGGLYWTKGEGGVPQLWGDASDPVINFRPQVPRPGEVMEVVGTGMGFNLWRISMFKDEKLRRPWFKTLAGPEGVGTQDLYFWNDARSNGYRAAVDCSVLVGHFDKSSGIVW